MECRTSGALRRKALGRILDLFPNDRDVYENWQKYAQIYAMGYKDAPDNMDDIVDYWGSLGHDYNAGFEEGTRRALLRIALSIVNNAIKHGESEGYLFDQVQTCASPECFAIVYLLYSCLQQTEEERLEIAKQDFIQKETDDDDENIIMEYGIGLETIKEWKSEAPQNRPYTKRYHAADPVLLNGALAVLQQLFPDQQSAYDEIETGLKIYLTGFYDSVKRLVITWLKKSGNSELIIQLLQELNILFRANTPPDQIPSYIINRAPEHTKPLFQLLINFYKESLYENS